MKKAVSLLLAVIMVLSIASVAHAWEYPYEQVRLKATVITCRYIESTDKFSFCAVGDIYGNGNRDPFIFGISREYLFFNDGIDELEMGRIITILFDGEIMESYPMQIVADIVFVEEEVEELSEDEKLSYLSMFYSEEWLIENGYMEVPPAEGEAIAPDVECDEDTTPPSENEEWEDGDIAEEDDESDSSLICGVPLEGDEDGKCILLSDRYLDGFVFGVEFSEPAYIPGQTEDLRGMAYIYFLAYSNFGDEMITPVLIEITEGRCAYLGTDMWSIDNGMNLRIHCSEGAYCVPADGELYYRLDGEVLTIEKLDGFTENYTDYTDYFWVQSEPSVDTVEDDIDTDDGGEVPIENDEKVASSDDADCGTENPKNSYETVLWIIGCSAIIIMSVTAIAVIIKKK